MSRLSLIEEPITSHSEICACGRKITRDTDKKNGICRLCNPFSLSNNNVSTLSQETEQTLERWDFVREYEKTN